MSSFCKSQLVYTSDNIRRGVSPSLTSPGVSLVMGSYVKHYPETKRQTTHGTYGRFVKENGYDTRVNSKYDSLCDIKDLVRR